ncbi:MAG: ribonuclease Y [Fimbriimonadaceae bacterium]|nr:ribonuclease Y [Fimbriimonadaceae bacterium]
MSDFATALIYGIGGGFATFALLYVLIVRPAYRQIELNRAEAKERADQLLEDAQSQARDRLTLVERQEARLYERESHLESRMDSVREAQRTADERLKEIDAELQRVANLSKNQARDLYLKRLEPEFRDIAARRALEIQAETTRPIESLAKKLLIETMQRNSASYLSEATTAVVELPNDEMKGRLIGREGRNIRAFEQITGVDLIIDETPETVLISCFDPVRRETARLALMNLMVDGRIHPGRIEELFEKAQQEVERTIREAGERAAERAQVSGLPLQVLEMMGRLRFRTSLAQNVLDHSVEVSHLAQMFAQELGLNAEVAKRAGFLHDIGKALGPEFEGPHAITGMQYLRDSGERDVVLNAIGAHHREIEPESAEAELVILADTLSASRPGARREALEVYIKRLSALETVANSFPGVVRSYAVQAGREIRLIVKPEEIDDLAAKRLAHQVARRLEMEIEISGQIRVTVIRETRATEIAR